MMKLAQLPLHITADEAETIIEFIDQLRSLLTNHYAHDIQRKHQAELKINQKTNPDIDWRDLENPNDLLF